MNKTAMSHRIHPFCSLRLVLSSASTTQSYFVLRFPTFGGVLHCNLSVFCKALLLASELSTFSERLPMPENARCSLGGNEQSLIPTHPQHQQRQRQDQKFGGGENFCSIFIFIFIFNFAGGPLCNGKRVGVHDNLHHLRNGGDFVPGENSSKIDGVCRQYTHKHCTYSAVQSLHKRGTHRALGSRIALHLCAPEKNLSSGPHMSHPLLLSHLPFTTSTSSSSLTLPSTTTQEHARQSDNTIYSKNTQYIINLSKTSQSTSGAINNHSGVKTAEWRKTRAKHSPQVMIQRACDCAQGSREKQIHNNYKMHRKNLENMIIELRSQKK